MKLTDRRGQTVTGATARALEAFESALALFQCYRGDPLAAIDRAIAEAPEFAMARCLRAYLGILATEKAGLELGRAEAAVLDGLRLSGREAGHRRAIRAYVDGDWEGGVLALESVLASEPRDVLALQTAHLSNFYLGDAKNLRDCVGRVRGAWEEQVPGYHAVLSMHAFGLEECGDYARAEREGRRAVELEPNDAWAHHAVTHVLEMQGRIGEGIAWMTSREPHWAVDNFFAVHNWWHLALYHLDRGEHDRVLDLYDRKIRGTQSKVILDVLDASSLLWRLTLGGVEVGEKRWSEIADAWGPLDQAGVYAFNDVHAAMTLLGAGRRARLRELEAIMRERSATGPGSNRAMSRDVGVPLVEALTAFVDGDYARTVDITRRVRPIANRFGGSHAQRDVIDQTLAEGALRSGQKDLALSLARERDDLRPGHPTARSIGARARAIGAGPKPSAD